jgi:hypothetical protein
MRSDQLLPILVGWLLVAATGGCSNLLGDFAVASDTTDGRDS